MSGTITLRPVRSDDHAFLLEVYGSTRDDIARSPLSPEERRTFVAMQCNAQRADYETRFPRSEHSIVMVDGVACGRIWVDRRADEIRLLDIALLTPFRNSGTGRALLGDLIAESRRRGVPLRHSVLVTNEAALRFYRRLGFEVVEDFGMHVLMELQPAGLSHG